MAEREKEHEMSGAHLSFANAKKRRKIDRIPKCGVAEKRMDKEMGSMSAKTKKRDKFCQASEKYK